MKKYQLGNTSSLVGREEPTILTTPKYAPSIYETPSEYDKGLIYRQNQAANRAYNQGNWDATLTKTSNVVQNIIPSAVENLALLPSLFMNENKSREYTESVDKIASRFKNWAGEVYTEDDNAAWWIDSLGSVVESGASFAVTGGAIGVGLKGAALATGLRSRKMASILQAINKGASIEDIAKGTQVVENIANTYFTSAVEGQLNGLESSKKIQAKYDNDIVYRSKIDAQARAKGVDTETYLKSIKDSAFASAANISTMIGVPLNFTGISSIFNSSRAISSYRKALQNTSMFDDVANTGKRLIEETPKIRTWKEFGSKVASEMVQEGIEEGGQSIAGKIAENRASKGKDSIALGDYYTAFNELESLGTSVFDKEFFTSMMLGALGGMAQTGFIEGISNQKKITEKDEIAYNTLKNDFLINVETVQNKKKELESIYDTIKSKDDFIKNKAKIDELNNEIYDITVKEALKRNSTDLLINDLQEILNNDGSTQKTKLQKDLQEFEKTNLEPFLKEQGMSKEEFDLVESNPNALSSQVLEEITSNPVYQQYQQLKEAIQEVNDTNIADNFDEDYKEQATQRIEELKNVQKRYNNFSPYFPSETENQRLNTIDVFMKEEKLSKVNKKINAKEEELALKNFDKELAKLLDEDLDYQVLLENQELDKANTYKENALNELKNSDKELQELYNNKAKLQKDIAMQSSNTYYEAIKDNKVVDEIGKNLKKENTEEEIKQQLEIDNFNNLVNEAYRKEISNKQEVNKKVEEAESSFETLQETLIKLLEEGKVDEAISTVKDILKYLPKTTENRERLDAILKNPEVLQSIAKAEAILILPEIVANSVITVEIDDILSSGEFVQEIQGIPLELTIDEFLGLVTDNLQDTQTSLIDFIKTKYNIQTPQSNDDTVDTLSYYPVETLQRNIDNTIARFQELEWNPIQKEKLRNKNEVLSAFIKDTLQGIKNNINNLKAEEELADIAELEKEKDKLDAFKVYLTNNIEENKQINDAIEALENLYATVKSDISAKIEANKNNEIVKYNTYNTPISEEDKETYKAQLKQPFSFNTKQNMKLNKFIYAVLKLRAYRDVKDKIKEDTFALVSRYEITDNFIKVVSEDNKALEKELKTLQKVFKEFAGREAEDFYNSTTFTEDIFKRELLAVVKDKFPTPEQLIAIKQGLALTLNRQHTFIQGLAGTGKTTIVAKYINDILINLGYNVEATAIGDLVHTKINKDLNKTATNSINEGITDYITTVKQDSIVIIDEAPKMTEAQANELEEALKKRPDLTILFTGDPRQLQGISKVSATAIFVKDIQISLTIPLTNSKRTGNSNVLKLQTAFTKGTDITKDTFIYETENEQIKEGVKSVNTSNELLNEAFKLEDKDFVIITNDTEKYKDSGYTVLSPMDAQGYDWNTVLIDLDDTATNDEKYVAASRAKNTIIIVDNFKSLEQPYVARKENTDRFKDNEQWFKETVQGENKKETTIKDVISNTDYKNFIDNGVVSDDIIVSIANKIINNITLSSRETEIFTDKTSEINSKILELSKLNKKDTPTITYNVNNGNLTKLLEKENLEDEIVYEVYGKKKNGVVTVFVVADVEGNGKFVEIAQRYEEIKKEDIVKNTYKRLPIYSNENVKIGIENPKGINSKKLDLANTNNISKITDNESLPLSDKIVDLINSVQRLSGNVNEEVEVSLKIATDRLEEDRDDTAFELNYILPSGSTYLKLVINKNRVFNIPIDGAVITENNNEDFKAIKTVMDEIKTIENEEIVFMSSKDSKFKVGSKYIPQGELFNDLQELAEGNTITGDSNKVEYVSNYFSSLSQDKKDFLASLNSKLYSVGVTNNFNNEDRITLDNVETNKNIIAQGDVEILEDLDNGYFKVRKSNYSKDIVIRKVINRVHKDKTDGTNKLHQIKMDYSITDNEEIDTTKEPRTVIFYVGQVEDEQIDDAFKNFKRDYTSGSLIYDNNVELFDKSKEYTLQEIEDTILEYDKSGKTLKGSKQYKKRTGLQRNFDNIVVANAKAEGGFQLRKTTKDEKTFPIWLSKMSDKHINENNEDGNYDTRDVINAFLSSKLYTPLQNKELMEFNNNPNLDSPLLKKMTTRSGGFKEANLLLKDLQVIEPVVTITEQKEDNLKDILEEVNKNLDSYSLQELAEKAKLIESKEDSIEDIGTNNLYEEVLQKINDKITKPDC